MTIAASDIKSRPVYQPLRPDATAVRHWLVLEAAAQNAGATLGPVKVIDPTGRACQTDEAKAVWANQGAEFPNLTGGQFDAFIKKELAKWSQVVKASGAKLD
mgnify:CR=1 FL=1